MFENKNNKELKVYNFIIILINILYEKNNNKYEKIIIEEKLKIYFERPFKTFNFLIKRDSIFSKITYNDIFKINDKTEMILPKDLYDIEKYVPDIIKIPNYLLDLITNELITKTKSIGIMSSVCDKENKKKLIDIFIYQTLNIFQGEIIDIMEKYYIIYKKNEYIIKSNKNILVVIIISEKDIEYQNSYGQIIILLYISYWYNNDNNINIKNVYGIVTSGNNWQWFKYDGIQIYSNNEIIQLRKNNPKSLSIIISYIYSIIIETWINSLKCINKYNFLINEINTCKNNIYNSKTDEESIKSFDKLKNIISEIKKVNNENNWNYDKNYLK